MTTFIEKIKFLSIGKKHLFSKHTGKFRNKKNINLAEANVVNEENETVDRLKFVHWSPFYFCNFLIIGKKLHFFKAKIFQSFYKNGSAENFNIFSVHYC